MATAFSLLGDQVLYSVLPVYYQELGISAVQVGILLSVNRWIRLLTNPLAHRVAGFGHSRLLLVVALFLGALTTFGYVATFSFVLLLAARLTWGLAWSFIRHLGVLRIMTDVPGDRAGRTMGIYNGLSRVGSVVGLFGGAFLVDLVGFHKAVVWLAIVSLLAVPIAFRGFGRNDVVVESASANRSGTFDRFSFLGFVLGAAGSGFVISTLGAVFDARLEGDLPLGLTAATVTGALLAVRFMLDTAAAPWLGSLADRLGVRSSSTVLFLIGAGALGAAIILVHPGAVAVAVVMFFVTATGLHAGIAGTVARAGSQRFSRYVSMNDFGAATGPALGWWLMDVIGEPTIGFVLAAMLYLLAAIAAWRWLTESESARATPGIR